MWETSKSRSCMCNAWSLTYMHRPPDIKDPELASNTSTSGCVCRVRTFRPCAAGEELTLSYGPLPNAKLLLFYGFAVEHNPHDAVSLSLQVCGWHAKGARDTVHFPARLLLECASRPQPRSLPHQPMECHSATMSEHECAQRTSISFVRCSTVCVLRLGCAVCGLRRTW